MTEAGPRQAPVISPCIGTCRINRRSRLCEGCRRTIGEIADWLSLSDAEKRAVIAELRNRDPFSDPPGG